MTSSLVIKKEREKSLTRRHPWIFEGSILQQLGRAKSGDTVEIVSESGEWLARGAYSPESQIRARVWTFNQAEPVDDAFFKRKIGAALDARQLLIQNHKTNAYRLVAAESDGLPGITIDVYDYVVVIQLLSAGAEKNRKKIVNALTSLFPDTVIHERSDVSIRKKEGLTPIVQTLKGELPNTINIFENNLSICVDLINGHKTGFYLDQRQNRQFVGSFAKNKKILNCFSYSGTFGLYALQNGAQHVTNVDASDSALEISMKNIHLNHFDHQKVTHSKQDVFELLRHLEKDNEKFDMIIMDPPKFVENKRHIQRASRGYKDINRLAFKLLNKGGFLFTFSCSGLMEGDLFQKIIADAALDANVEAQIVKRLEQDQDHPVATNFPEGYYLKGLMCRVIK